MIISGFDSTLKEGIFRSQEIGNGLGSFCFLTEQSSGGLQASLTKVIHFLIQSDK